eukprot:278728_1
MMFLLLLFLFLSEHLASAGKLSCDYCKEVIKEVDRIIAENGTIMTIEELAIVICELDHAGGECEGPYDSWQCKQVCELAIQTYEPMVDYLLIRYLDPALICYNIENNTFGCEKPIPPDPTPVPNIIEDNSSRPVYNSSNQYGYILQIPDVHWDQQYTPNSVANCGEPVCCRSYDNNHNYSKPVIYGGKYGIANESINCDTPVTVIQSMVDYIANDIILNNSDGININNLDFMVFVGDAESNDVYNQSKIQHLDLIQDFINILKNGLSKFHIPIFFDLGNHEGLPVDNFGGPPLDNWFNNPVGQWLSQWIDTKYSIQFDSRKPSQIMSYSGYYTSLIRPGFRLISINSGYTAGGNYYLTFTQWDDPYIDLGGQFKWLNNTLHRSKYILNEQVVIIQHHPISSAVEQFQKLYYDLYAEYQDIIITIFAGHTHCDHYHSLGNNNFTSKSSNKPFATWFSSGSVVQYGGRNPAFRVFKYNRQNYDLVNFYQYRFDTERSNMENRPYWFKAYDAKSEYNMKDVSPQSMSDLAYELGVNDTLWKRFEYNYYSGVYHDGSLNRNATVCDLLSATNQQYDDCTKNMFMSQITAKEYEALYW